MNLVEKCITTGSFMLMTIVLCTSNLHSQQILKLGQPIDTSLAKDETHIYSFVVEQNQYIFGRILQKSTDVNITVKDPGGNILEQINSFIRGSEPFSLETDTAGTYTLEVNGSMGQYVLSMERQERIAKDPKERVRQWLLPYDSQNTPGVAVLVIRDGKPIYREDFGSANLTHSIPMQANTRHNIGSTSKQFTAFGLALLAEKSDLSLEDDVRKYIPELPDFSDTVRLSHLLGHSSGYREFLNTLIMMGQHPSTPFPRNKIIEMIERQPELQSQPGTEFNYNNTGYSLVAEVIERKTEMPFEDWMNREVFEPLGMTETGYRAHNHQIVPNRSIGYAPSDSKEGYQEITDLGGGMGPGALYITLRDFTRWIQHYDAPTLCSQQTMKRMMTPDTLSSGNPTAYGLGLFIQEHKRQRYIHHGGADLAHRSHMLYFPEISGAVVIQSNASNFPGDLPIKIANLFFEEFFEEEQEQENKSPTSADASFSYNNESFEPLTGKYELKIMPGFVLNFFEKEGKIMTQATGQPAIPLKATSDSTFTIVGVPNASITFHLEEDGPAQSLTLHQNGNHKAERVHWDPKTEELMQYSGTYYSEEIATVLQLQMKDSSLHLQHLRYPEPSKLHPSQEDRFSIQNTFTAFGDIRFDRNEKNEVQGFYLSNGRTKDVYFQLLNLEK
jgi:CubicO group peptidase (beta-lactamase class C family)